MVLFMTLALIFLHVFFFEMLCWGYIGMFTKALKHTIAEPTPFIILPYPSPPIPETVPSQSFNEKF
jgi:hypothetical protein